MLNFWTKDGVGVELLDNQFKYTSFWQRGVSLLQQFNVLLNYCRETIEDAKRRLKKHITECTLHWQKIYADLIHIWFKKPQKEKSEDVRTGVLGSYFLGLSAWENID